MKEAFFWLVVCISFASGLAVGGTVHGLHVYAIRENAFKANAGHWVADPATGETSWVWTGAEVKK